MSIFIASLDCGQIQDYSALVIMQAQGTPRRVIYDERTGYETPVEVLPVTMIDIRHVERFPLGLRYRQIAELVIDRVSRTPKPVYFVLDETGVGVSVIEDFGRLRPHGITITAGKTATTPAPRKYHVPKRDLISAAQVRLQNHTLRIADAVPDVLPHAKLLIKELLSFRVKISVSGHDTYEAWREQEHDDLVLAAAQGVWFAEEIFRQMHAAVQERLLGARIQGGYQISPV